MLKPSCNIILAPKPMGHCDTKMPGHVIVLLMPRMQCTKVTLPGGSMQLRVDVVHMCLTLQVVYHQAIICCAVLVAVPVLCLLLYYEESCCCNLGVKLCTVNNL